MYRTHACLAQAAAAGTIPTTVRMEMVGTIVSVMAGGPSKKVSSGVRVAAGLAAGVLPLFSPDLRFPRFIYIFQFNGKMDGSRWGKKTLCEYKCVSRIVLVANNYLSYLISVFSLSPHVHVHSSIRDRYQKTKTDLGSSSS